MRVRRQPGRGVGENAIHRSTVGRDRCAAILEYDVAGGIGGRLPIGLHSCGDRNRLTISGGIGRRTQRGRRCRRRCGGHRRHAGITRPEPEFIHRDAVRRIVQVERDALEAKVGGVLAREAGHRRARVQIRAAQIGRARIAEHPNIGVVGASRGAQFKLNHDKHGGAHAHRTQSARSPSVAHPDTPGAVAADGGDL